MTSSQPPVRVERDGPVTTVILDRPAGQGPLGPTRMRLTKPVIAAVSGYAVAGGLELALWADLRVADGSAVFGVFCRRWGVPLIDGGTVRLPRLIGTSRAMDEPTAMQNEFRHGEFSLAADTVAGARRFAEGAGRHGGADSGRA